MTPDRKAPPVLVRFTASDGVQWTIHDVTWSRGKYHRRPHADPTATERVFVNEKGEKRAYRFKPSDSRVLEEQSLERQLRESKFLPREKDDPSVYSLSEAERGRRRSPIHCAASSPSHREAGAARGTSARVRALR
jgi:hypothetical protein